MDEPTDEATLNPDAAKQESAKRARVRIITGVVVLGILWAFALCHQSPKGPGYVNQTLRRGLDAHKNGNLREAEQDYLEVLKVQPGNQFANFNLGIIEQQRNHLVAAEKYYRRALKTQPTFSAAMFNLALVRDQLGASQEAADIYRKILQIDPRSANAHFNLGYLLLQKLGQPAEGRAEMKKAVELNPQLASRVPK